MPLSPRTYTHLPTTVTAHVFDPANPQPWIKVTAIADTGGRSRYRVRYAGAEREVNPGDWIIITPNQCWYAVEPDRFRQLYTLIDTPSDAARLLLKTIAHIQQLGFDIAGIDPNGVRFTERPPPPGIDELGDPLPLPVGEGPLHEGPGPRAEGLCLDGDLSSCCGAPLQRTGTCNTCTACGTSDGGCG